MEGFILLESIKSGMGLSQLDLTLIIINFLNQMLKSQYEFKSYADKKYYT